MPDPVTIIQGIGALKTVIDSIRGAVGLAKDVRLYGGSTEQQQQVIEASLTLASSNAAIAEMQLAQAFGYELCKCDFPPTPMRTVGYFNRDHGERRAGDAVYECPKCGTTNAGPFNYQRTVPERQKAG